MVFGMGNSVMTLVVRLSSAILFALLSTNHKLLSGPELIPVAPLLDVGMKNDLNTRVVGLSCSMTFALAVVK